MSDNLSSKMKGDTKLVDSSGADAGLPVSYNDTKIVIMPRDPSWLFSYWEISNEDLSALQSKIGTENFNSGRRVLRVYDVTGVDFNGNNAVKSFDLDVSKESKSWYVNVSEVNRSWCIDLGVITSGGEFMLISRSNILNMPRHGISPVTDEQWAVLKEEFERLLKLSGVDQIGKSSFDVAKLMKERWEEIVQISMPSSLAGASSFFKKADSSKGNKFWLKADTEVVVYGSTEPDAKLTVQGRPVTLYPDGSFSLRFCLADGKQEYPIEAKSADGNMKEKIIFGIERKTK